jgi:hypothetical protein
MNRAARRLALLLTLAVVGCQASTTRPGFLPLPEASTTDLRLEVPQATRLLAEGLAADSFLIRRVEERDGYLEGEWIRYPGWEQVDAPVYNSSVIKVRAWVDPGAQFWSRVSVEVVYRIAVDPSRDPRDFERSISPSHTAHQIVVAVLRALALKYGDLVEEKPGATPRTP